MPAFLPVQQKTRDMKNMKGTNGPLFIDVIKKDPVFISNQHNVSFVSLRVFTFNLLLLMNNSTKQVL